MKAQFGVLDLSKMWQGGGMVAKLVHIPVNVPK